MKKEILSKYVHIMKYMGSKRELLEHIEKIVIDNNKDKKPVLDLFAGTCSVGLCLRDRFPVYSNDVQSYSKIISEGIIQNSFFGEMSKKEIWDVLAPNFKKNYQNVESKIPKILKKSRDFSSIKLSEWNEGSLKNYKLFLKSLPSPENEKQSNNLESKWLLDEYETRTSDPTTFPYIQTTFLFGEMYFSLEQALMIDSLKYSIENLPKELKSLQKILRVALLHTHSYSSAGTGHFAQFRDLSTLESVKDVFIYRQKSVEEYFLNKTCEILSTLNINKCPKDSKSFSENYLRILKSKNIMSQVGLVYADPPYSFVHYSRFYHATENLCRYDYPVVKFKGRYRIDRHQSPFCIKTKVEQSFNDLFINTSKFKVPLLISYSDTGMIDFETIIKLSTQQGMKVSLIELEHKHSTLGRQKDKDRPVSEKLILCI